MADKNTVYMSEKQKVKEITDKLEAGLKELFESEKYKSYLSTMSKFHNYSFNNTLLIAMQKPEATLVAGYQAWQKNFERHVNKGEKAIRTGRRHITANNIQNSKNRICLQKILENPFWT